MAVEVCSNPANGTHIVVRGNQRDETLKSVLQRVMKWAEEDAHLIEFHHNTSGPSFVRIPPEVIAQGHGPLTLVKGGPEIEQGLNKPVWIEPDIFSVDGVNPNTLIEYDQKIEDFKTREEPTHDKIVLKFRYDGNSQEKTEPSGWLLRWRRKAAKDECEAQWELWDLRPQTRVITLQALDPDTEYEFTLQGKAIPTSTDVWTQSTKPITVKTKKKPAPGDEPKPGPRPVPQPPKDQSVPGEEPKPAPGGKGGGRKVGPVT